MRLRTIVVILTGVLLPSGGQLAQAHVGATPEALDVFVPADGGTAIALESSFGLLLSDGGPEYRWLCHEAIIELGSTVTPRYAMNSQGVILGTTGVLGSSRDTDETLYRTTDQCNWLTTSGLTDKVATDVAFSPVDPNRAIVSTATLQSGTADGLYFSDDAGATWQASDMLTSERLFRNVHFGPDGTAWATSSWFNPLGSWLYRSDDGGVTWQEIEFLYEAKGSRQVLLDVLVAGDDGQNVWLRVDAPISDRLVHSSDGGASFSEVLHLTTDMKTAARTNDGRSWLVDGYGRLHRTEVGGAFFPLNSSPSVSGAGADSRGLFVSTRVGDEDFALMLNEDGDSFAGLFVLSDVSPPPSCDPGSHSVERCEPYWETVVASLAAGDDDDSAGDDDDSATGDDDSEAGDDDTGDDDDSSGNDDGAGCCSDNEEEANGTAVALVLVLGLGGSLRRRARSCP